MSDNDHIDAIRKRRAARLSGKSPALWNDPARVQVDADIDYLLDEVAYLRRVCDAGSEVAEIMNRKLVDKCAEVERLRSVLNLVPLIRAATDEEFAAALAKVDADLQALTDTSQELGLYEEADNPLVKDDDTGDDQ